MDPVTHCLIGGMIAKTVPAKETSTPWQKKLWFWTIFFAAEFPDCDILPDVVLYLLKVPYSPMLFHRGITHSFFGALFFGTWGALYLSRWFPDQFYRLWAVLIIALTGHVVGDWMTSYGTPLFAPFSLKNYSLDWVSNVTLIPMGIFAVTLMAAKMRQTKKCIAAGLISFLIFTGFSAISHRRSLELAGPKSVASLPHLIQPFKWHVICSDGEKYEMRMVNLRTGENRLMGRYFKLEHFMNDPVVAKTLDSIRVRRFLWFNRWPAGKVERRNSETVIEIGNLLFRWSGNGRLNDALKITVDAQGNLLHFERVSFEPEP